MIEEVEELGAEVQAHLFRGSANCLMTEKSVLTKSGPTTGTREALPNSPAGGRDEAGWVDPLQLAVVRVVDVATGDLVGPVPVVVVAAVIEEDAGLVIAVDQGTGNPEEILSIRVTWKLPRRCWSGFQPLPNCFALAEGQIVDERCR
jgi:hypothetical protein